MTGPISTQKPHLEPDARLHDVVVIGAGPVGLFSAYYAGFRGLRALVVDALPHVGGQVSLLYPSKGIYDVAGFPEIKGADFIDALRQQADRHGPTFDLGRRVNGIEGEAGNFSVCFEEHPPVRARRVVLSLGLGAFEPRVLPAAKKRSIRGVEYFVHDLEALRDRDVVVVGGGDSAVDWANHASLTARSTTVVHRRGRFTAHEASVASLMESAAQVLLTSEVLELRGEEEVEEVLIRNDAGETRVLAADLVIAALGFMNRLDAVESWGIELERRHIAVGSDMQTSREGIYAVGDCSSYEGKVRLIAVGFGEAAIAVNHLAVGLDQSVSLFPGHSTHLEGG